MTGTPRTRAVPVHGGELAVAEWGSEDGPVVLAVHGITASSRAWLALADLIPETRLVAPDLRGRGRSRDLPAPFGLRQHVEDLQRVLDAVGARRVVVAGHSMGAFVAVLLAAAEPERVAELVLVDGGLPLPLPPGAATVPAPEVLLGPVFARLSRVFASAAEYREFWREHPAFTGAWTDDVAAYADHDLRPVPGGFGASAVPEAVATDQAELFGPDWYRAALDSLQQPVTVLRAPLGLQAEPPGLYPPGWLDAFAADLPTLEVVEVPAVNHYTVLMTRPGVDLVASTLCRALRPLDPAR